MRHQLAISIFLCACVLLPGAVTASAQIIRPSDAARVGLPPQERMEALARTLNLGAKRADSARPQPTTSGHGDGLRGFYQCFERGCVYYSAETDVRAVSGTIFIKFVADGYERGALGLPVSEEQACVQPAGFRYQIFEGGRIVWNNVANTAATFRNPSRVGDGGNCQSLPAPASRGSARFRVTINGFACHRPTFDDASQSDGVDDEIYVKADPLLYDLVDRRSQLPAESSVMGDTNGFPGRIRAGSGHSIVGGNGGFSEGDTFPMGGRPWTRTSAPGDSQPPLRVWEGELAGGSNALVLIPSIWEWDSPVHLNREIGNHYTRALAATIDDGDFESEIRRIITGGGSVTSIVSAANLRRLFDGVRMMKDTAGAGSRPVGMVDRGAYYAFDPRALVLTYDSAVRIATSNNNGLGLGVIPLSFRDDDTLRGLYTLYIQVERLP